MKKIKEIYLTAGDEDENLVWCEDKVTDEDVKYIRADILKSSLLSQREEIKEMVEGKKVTNNDNNRSVEGLYLFNEGYNQALKDILENLKQ